MKYTKPSYEIESLQTNEVILPSVINGTSLVTGDNPASAQVSTDMSFILGFR